MILEILLKSAQIYSATSPSVILLFQCHSQPSLDAPPSATEVLGVLKCYSFGPPKLNPLKKLRSHKRKIYMAFVFSPTLLGRKRGGHFEHSPLLAVLRFCESS